jgi:hypothetical protein
MVLWMAKMTSGALKGKAHLNMVYILVLHRVNRGLPPVKAITRVVEVDEIDKWIRHCERKPFWVIKSNSPKQILLHFRVHIDSNLAEDHNIFLWPGKVDFVGPFLLPQDCLCEVLHAVNW